MPLFSRRRRRGRADVGRFEPPPALPVAPVEQVVEEGAMIARSAARMAVKNAVILSALRDRDDLDRDALARLATEQLRLAAEQEREAIERLYAARAHGKGERDRIHAIRAGLAESLEEAAADAAVLDELVEQARVAAWGEIADALRTRAEHAGGVGDEPGYAESRGARMLDLGAELAALAESPDAD